MPSAYMCVYTGNATNGQVMIALKNQVCAWHGYTTADGGRYEDWRRKPSSQVPLPAPVLHNPGQHVLPGGTVDQKENMIETLRHAAYREFQEETGVILPEFVNNSGGTMKEKSRYFTGNNNYDKPQEGGYDFGVVYVELDRKSFDAVVAEVNKNLNFNKPLHEAVRVCYEKGLKTVQASSNQSRPMRDKPTFAPRHNYTSNTRSKQIGDNKPQNEYKLRPWQILQDTLKEDDYYTQRFSNVAPKTKDDELNSALFPNFKTATDTIQAQNKDGKSGWFVEALSYLTSITTETSQSSLNTQTGSSKEENSPKAEQLVDAPVT